MKLGIGNIKFRERNPVVIAVVGLAALFGVLFGSFQLVALPVIAGNSYVALFEEGGGLKVGDDVKVAGTRVGSVTSVDLVDGFVEVVFTARDVSFGQDSTAEIKTQTLLGERNLGIVSRGSGEMAAGDVIPIDRTTSPYSITQGIEDLTRRSSEIDMGRASDALDTFGAAFAETSDELTPALEGIARLSRTVASRDEALRTLLAHAEAVTGTLADKSTQLTSLVANGNLLLGELEARRKVIRRLLTETVRLTDEIVGFTEEQRDKLRPMLDELNHTVGILRRNESNIVSAIQRVSTFIIGLGEGIAAGPYFTGVADAGGIGAFPTAQFIPGLAIPSPFPDEPGPELPVPPVGELIGQGVN